MRISQDLLCTRPPPKAMCLVRTVCRQRYAWLGIAQLCLAWRLCAASVPANCCHRQRYNRAAGLVASYTLAPACRQVCMRHVQGSGVYCCSSLPKRSNYRHSVRPSAAVRARHYGCLSASRGRHNGVRGGQRSIMCQTAAVHHMLFIYWLYTFVALLYCCRNVSLLVVCYRCATTYHWLIILFSAGAI